MNKKKSNTSLILGCLAITADVCGLIAFATGFAVPNPSSFLMHPALWAVIQFSLTLYGNLAIAYFVTIVINNIYGSYDDYDDEDIDKTYMLVVFLIWIPTIVVWLVSILILSGWHGGVKLFVFIFTIFGVLGGGYFVVSSGALIARTLRPDLKIRIKIE